MLTSLWKNSVSSLKKEMPFHAIVKLETGSSMTRLTNLPQIALKHGPNTRMRLRGGPEIEFHGWVQNQCSQDS